ncbi:MAG: hypothetical protein GAK37_02900 [Pseudomonas sp.]|nr:MAG: hypothetical protein GAK37_02900 [Pseudomonas sp.]
MALAFGQPLALPATVVGIVQGQRGQLKGLALGRGGVQAGEFVQQDGQRPTVGDDVVHHHQQLVVFIVQAHQRYPQQRALFQVELGAGFVFADLLRAGFTLGGGQVAEVDDLQLEVGTGINALEGLAVALIEACAQGFVALDQLLEAVAHGVFVQLATQPQATGNGVGAAVRVQLPGDPQAVLCQGLGQVFGARQGMDRPLGGAAVLLQLRDFVGEG